MTARSAADMSILQVVVERAAHLGHDPTVPFARVIEQIRFSQIHRRSHERQNWCDHSIEHDLCCCSCKLKFSCRSLVRLGLGREDDQPKLSVAAYGQGTLDGFTKSDGELHVFGQVGNSQWHVVKLNLRSRTRSPFCDDPLFETLFDDVVFHFIPACAIASRRTPDGA